jgi:hypothetical protein
LFVHILGSLIPVLTCSDAHAKPQKSLGVNEVPMFQRNLLSPSSWSSIQKMAAAASSETLVPIY